MKKIETYIINLEHRIDRKISAIEEFADRREFDVKITKAVKDKIGSYGLWQTIQMILAKVNSRTDLILLCQDDHIFTKDYSFDYLKDCIAIAESQETEMLLGGVSWFDYGLHTSSNLFWINEFNGLQFCVLFNKIFDTIKSTEFQIGTPCDCKLSSLTSKTLVMHPFISIQREFGYSDVTPKNNEDGYVSKLFEDTSKKMFHLKKVSKYYKIL